MANLSQNFISTKLFPDPVEPDPVFELEQYLRDKAEGIRSYMERPDANEAYRNRLISDYERLEAIHGKLEELTLYQLWCELEADLMYWRNSGGADALRITLPVTTRPVDAGKIAEKSFIKNWKTHD